MLKSLIKVTKPTIPNLAREIKRDLEAKGCEVYLTSVVVDHGKKNQRKRLVVWRKADQEDRADGIKTKKVEVG